MKMFPAIFDRSVSIRSEKISCLPNGNREIGGIKQKYAECCSKIAESKC